jgi:hypothetical protein
MARRDDNAAYSIVGYLLSGLLFWGGVGWALDRHYLSTFGRSNPGRWCCSVLGLAPFRARISPALSPFFDFTGGDFSP